MTTEKEPQKSNGLRTNRYSQVVISLQRVADVNKTNVKIATNAKENN